MVSVNDLLSGFRGKEECLYRLEVNVIKQVGQWILRLVLFTLSITTQHENIFINPIMFIPLHYC